MSEQSRSEQSHTEQSRFDVLVVGGGSAGCVVAARLSEDPARSVGLVEAGPDYGPESDGRWPVDLLDANFDAVESHDWGFDGGLSSTRARVIGGCSAHNGCAAVMGAPRDYDEWGALALEAWSWETLRPCVELVQIAMGVRPTDPTALEPMRRAFLEAALEEGFPLVEFNEPDAVLGVAPVPMNARGSVRWNAAFGYLDPARGRPNLHILAETLVDRLKIARGRCTEVIGFRSGQELALSADLVVLAAGAYASPAILMRSGLGPVEELRRFQIPVAVDLPGVGTGLLDHPYVDVFFEPSDIGRIEAGRFLAGAAEAGQTLLKAASSRCEAGTWDLLLGGWSDPSRDASGRPVGTRRNGIMAGIAQPISEGSVRLRAADPAILPTVAHGFLSDPEGIDLGALLEAIDLARRLGRTRAIRRLTIGEISPGEDMATRAELQTFALINVLGTYHPLRTCRMGGPDNPLGVVDGAGRVRGLANVLVVDASILPTMPRANIHMTVLAVAEKLAHELRAW